MHTSVAIIGAGLAGLTAGQRLSRCGFRVDIFDKGRGAGGRMSTRREIHDGQTLYFDHGAQYFTVRDRRFAAQVQAWEDQGWAAAWPEAGPQAYTGTPMMCSPLVHMAQAAGVRFGVRIDRLSQTAQGWQLSSESGDFGPYDAVIVAIPAEQAAELLRVPAPDMADVAARQVSQPCWTTMVALPEPLPWHAPVTRAGGPVLAWIARDGSKPGRTTQTSWVLQSTAAWAQGALGLDRETAARAMVEAWRAMAGRDLPAPVFSRGHLWRYARSAGSGEDYLWSQALRIGVCGDWLIGPRVEAAWLSGFRLADAVTHVRTGI